MLCTNIERAIASAFDKTYAHLAEDATIVDAQMAAQRRCARSSKSTRAAHGGTSASRA